jgi:hypothetical protein
VEEEDPAGGKRLQAASPKAPSGVGGQNGERLTVERRDGAEVALVEAEDARSAVACGEG